MFPAGRLERPPAKQCSEIKVNPMPNLDPKNINARLYNQVSHLLDQLETGDTVTLKERIAALVAIGRIQTIFLNLRLKGDKDEPAEGSSIRKYTTAFQAHDTRRRKAVARAAATELDDPGVDDLLGDDDEDRDSA